MLLSQKAQKEGTAVDNLLHISEEEKEKSFKKDIFRSQKESHENNYILPWSTCYTDVSNSPSNVLLEKFQKPTKFEVNQRDTKSKESRRSVRFSNRSTLLCDGNVKFYHFDNIREYMAHYRESVTVVSIMEYRKGLTVPDKLSLCSKCARNYSPYDLVKHCHCFSPLQQTQSSVINSTAVCYVSDKASRYIMLKSPQKQPEVEEQKASRRQVNDKKKTVHRNSDKTRSNNLGMKKAASSYANSFCSSMAIHKKVHSNVVS